MLFHVQYINFVNTTIFRLRADLGVTSFRRMVDCGLDGGEGVGVGVGGSARGKIK